MQRHGRIVPSCAPRRQENIWNYPTRTGFFTTGAAACDQASPSSSNASCVDERQIAPSATGGQTNLPLSSHFVARTMPLPSHASSLIRSFRFERKTNISPPYGSAQSACATSATSPCTPRRKSIGCVATHTRSPARVAIKPGRPAPPPAPATTSPCRHPPPPVCLRHPARSRSRRPPVGDQPAHRTAVLPRRPSPAQK